ncbi:hypothetical protein HY213_03725 [Candidatus Peregrinibacteria bacterium]|nr:hypothetical protein [Candidatus Peregrinibacteria bacterium]
MSRPFALQETIEQGCVVPLADLPHDSPRQLKSILETEPAFYVSRRLERNRIRCRAALNMIVLPEDVVDIMCAAAPEPNFAAEPLQILADLDLPKNWRAGLEYSDRLYNLHALRFGKKWTEELVPIADRFRKYLLPVEKAEDEDYLRVNQISLQEYSDRGFPTCTHDDGKVFAC